MFLANLTILYHSSHYSFQFLYIFSFKGTRLLLHNLVLGLSLLRPPSYLYPYIGMPFCFVQAYLSQTFLFIWLSRVGIPWTITTSSFSLFCACITVSTTLCIAVGLLLLSPIVSGIFYCWTPSSTDGSSHLILIMVKPFAVSLVLYPSANKLI